MYPPHAQFKPERLRLCAAAAVLVLSIAAAALLALAADARSSWPDVQVAVMTPCRGDVPAGVYADPKAARTQPPCRP